MSFTFVSLSATVTSVVSCVPVPAEPVALTTMLCALLKPSKLFVSAAARPAVVNVIAPVAESIAYAFTGAC